MTYGPFFFFTYKFTDKKEDELPNDITSANLYVFGGSW